MGVNSTPLLWPAAWKNPELLGLLQATPIRQILVEAKPPGLVEQAARAGLTIIEPQALPPGVMAVKGPWPGIRLSHAGGDRTAAGPTGEPWVDSNGWRIRVAKATHPGVEIWLDSKPQASRASLEDYVVAFADATAHGARWIVALDDTLAAGIAENKLDAMARWKRIMEASAFFHAEGTQAGFGDDAVIGVLSSFSGPKLGFTDEVLNNLARTKQQYCALSVNALAPAKLSGLKAVLYTDGAEPPDNVRKPVLEFVNAGGLLITGPGWGAIPKGEPQQGHPRFAVRKVGKGAIAVASTTFSDPYRVPNDAVVLVSHRHDTVRFFNSGAITPCLAASADKKRAVLDTVFYSLRPVEDTSLWVKGSYKSARMRSWNHPQTQTIKLENRDAGVELYLPAVAQFARVELEA